LSYSALPKALWSGTLFPFFLPHRTLWSNPSHLVLNKLMQWSENVSKWALCSTATSACFINTGPTLFLLEPQFPHQ
jgi:hypothetical protein